MIFLKKAIILFSVCIILPIIGVAQNAVNYSWVSGSSTFIQTANYGSKGVASSSTIPGARENSVSWIDSNNNLWLFAGNGYNASGKGYLNDLWKYNISSNQWVWMSGTSTLGSTGNYSAKGVSNTTVYPSARQNAVTWTDNAGLLWLFGGQKTQNNFLNDLWYFNPSNNQWTWVSGSNTTNQKSVYGTKGVAGSNNVPGARFGALSWYDNVNNELWLFGGQQYTSNTERVNDLWKYNITTNQWTWVSGDSVANAFGIYGTKGVSNTTNTPGARQASLTWVDDNNNFWLHGGDGYPGSGSMGYLNDLWKFNTTTHEWSWVNGSNTISQGANYGTMGTASSSSIPGARQMSVSFKDNENNLWLFGGWGFVGPTFGRLNDLWKYNISTNEWSWMGGSNITDQSGVYGSKGSMSSSTIPGARRMSISWTDNNGTMWLFGGNGYDSLDSLGVLNDLWKIDVNATTNINTNDLQTVKVSLYPNPIVESMIIEMNDGNKHFYEITSLTGTEIQKGYFADGEKILLPKLTPGVYIVTIDTIVTTKIIYE